MQNRLLSPVQVAFLASLMLFAIFCFIVLQIVTVGMTVEDYRLMQLVHDLQQATPNLTWLVGVTSDVLGTWAFVGITGFGCLELVRRRHYGLAVVWVATLTGTVAITELCKHIFHRLRPPYAGVEEDYSFPSGHSIRAIVGYGFLAYVILRSQRRTWIQSTTVMIATTLSLVVGFTRVYLGKDFPSDVTGAYAIGGSILAAAIGGLEARTCRMAGPTMHPTSAPRAAPT